MPPPTKKLNNTYVYIRSKESCWVPVIQLDAVPGKRATVIRPHVKTEQQLLQSDTRRSKKFSHEEEIDLSEYPDGVLPMQNVDSNGKLEDYKDMVDLPFMHEAALLYNLKRRHIAEKPYTRTGDIIIAVNPYKWLTELYTEKKRAYYSNRLVWDHSEEDPRSTMEPHVYEVSALSYKGLATDGKDQSILVSGESGAGKTETVKICLNHIASTQRGPCADTFYGENDPVVQRVVDSNPLLEAFGNAKTRRNDNSSRFGKYLQLQFDMRGKRAGKIDTTSRCALKGSKCEVYLLEKNRVVKHESAERTFHIFYQLLASSDSQKTQFWCKLAGTSNTSFAYVGHTNTDTIEGIHDADKFGETLRALELVGVKGEKLKMLMQAICTVLQLGNLGFGSKGGDTDKSTVTTKAELSDLADLMQIKKKDLIASFTERTMKTRVESYKVPLNPEGAKDACDALAKEIYQKVFLWLVNTINEATAANDGGESSNLGVIGLLDIFGFEAFKVNRFEQLCINYANEKLQQKFTQDVFRSVQEEYESEGIPLKEIYYDDNTDVLDLIEGRTGLLAMLNEECIRPKGNDFDFVQKALRANSASKCLIVHRTDRMSFGIRHFAGTVMYNAEFFVNSNQDTLPTDLQECAQKCSNEIVRAARSEPAVGDRDKEQQGKTRLEKAQNHVRQESNIVAASVWTKYRNQLNNLMGMLKLTRSRYIRCIKPNNSKAPLLMEHEPVVEQLRCAGVVAGIIITRSVFPNGLENSMILARYSSLFDPKYPSKKTKSMSAKEQRAEDCKALLQAALRTKRVQNDKGEWIDAFVVGKTKSYFRAGALEWLEMNRLSDLDAHVIVIQRAARAWLARNAGKGSRKRRQQEELKKRLLQEEDAHRTQFLKEAKVRRKQQQTELAEIRRQAFELKEKIAKTDRDTKTKMAELKRRAEAARRENAVYAEMMRELEDKRIRQETAAIKSQQEKKIEENRQIIAYLKKEAIKARKEHEKIKAKLYPIRSNNDKLVAANETTGDIFDDLNDTTGRIHSRNEDLTCALEQAKRQNKKLKEQVLCLQDEYMCQAETRLEYQKGMARILNMIQDRSKNHDLVEQTVVVALECEGESKAIMAALEAETEPDMIGSDVSESSGVW